MKSTINKLILIIGGLGFIGSHLCLRLLKQGHRIIYLDNLSTGQRRNLYELESYCNFQFAQWDITNLFTWKEAIGEIYNLACPASPVHFQSVPVPPPAPPCWTFSICMNWHVSTGVNSCKPSMGILQFLPKMRAISEM